MKLNEYSKETNSKTLITSFHEHGYVIIRNFYPQTLIENLIKATEKIVDEFVVQLVADGKLKETFPCESFHRRFYSVMKNSSAKMINGIQKQLHREPFFDLFANPTTLNIIEEFLGHEIRIYPNYTMRPKVPEWEGHRVLWHQDAGYTNIKLSGPIQSLGTLSMVNLWVSLVPANVTNGCMQFIPKSHLNGVLPHVMKEHYLEVEDEFIIPLINQAIDIELDPCDVVLFHNLLIHQGLPNHSEGIRWSLDWRYQDATQPTNRKEEGYILRSKQRHNEVITSGVHWEQLEWGGRSTISM